jgi:FtsP/CotA-like multicopper oxidase with cupredoxin domain
VKVFELTAKAVEWQILDDVTVTAFTYNGTVPGPMIRVTEGATVNVSADHTDITGMGLSGAATDQCAGKYSIKANFSMSGNWKIKVYVRKDGLDYSEEIDLPVQ